MNFIRGGTQFNAGATTTGGFLTLDQVETPLFGNRLGYVGVDFGAAGRLTVGKQNAVHYDIASYTTDRWNVFGGQGSIAYPAGTDGGTLGVGRVDQAVSYRARSAEDPRARRPAPVPQRGQQRGLGRLRRLGAGDGPAGAEARRRLHRDVLLPGRQGRDPGLEGSAQYTILGASYSSELLDLGAVWATQRNGDAVHFRSPTSSTGRPRSCRWCSTATGSSSTPGPTSAASRCSAASSTTRPTQSTTGSTPTSASATSSWAARCSSRRTATPTRSGGSTTAGARRATKAPASSRSACATVSRQGAARPVLGGKQ